MLSGDPNLGKSFLTLDVAARTSTGAGWPDASPGDDGGAGVTSDPDGSDVVQHDVSDSLRESTTPSSTPGDVLLLSAEDDVADTIRPRLEAAGADLDRVHVLTGRREASGSRLVSLERDLDELEPLVARPGRFRLIVVDPISAYLEGLDMNRQQEVRSLLHRLSRLAEHSRAAVVVVSHLRKTGQKGPAIYRTLGSLAFTAVARAVWNVVKDPADPNRRLMVPVKLNLSPDPTAMAFRLVEPGVVQWEPEPIEISADEVCLEELAETDENDRLAAARIWMRKFLADGPKTSREVKSAARLAGISRRSMWAAKRELKVDANNKHSRAYKWYLPEHQTIDPDELSFAAGGISPGELLRALGPTPAAAFERAPHQARRAGSN